MIKEKQKNEKPEKIGFLFWTSRNSKSRASQVSSL